MKEVDIELTLGEIKGLYEYFLDSYGKEGLTVDWSILTYKNLKMLSQPYEQIISGEYDEKRDPQFAEYSQKMNKLLQKYVDRDEQANPIMLPNGEPQIIELIVEFQKEQKKLDEEYKDLVAKLENKTNINRKFLSQKVKVKIYTVEKEEIPDKVPPIIVSTLLTDI